MQPISVIVLAGGSSRRMGTNKALLAINARETLVSRVVSNMQPLSKDLILVSNTPDAYTDLQVRQVSDRYTDCGPLAGLHSGLHAARHEWSFAMACDMPLVDHRLVRYMILLTQGHQAVVPQLSDKVEPLHALYHKSCLDPIETHLQAGERRMISFYPDIHVRYVDRREVGIFDPEGRSFYNANTPADWERLKMLLKTKKRR